ncbi:MAG TPA: response regulator [Thermoanaerobaculia bacterium]|jgi:CheY-like chemotaxis protein
MKILVIDDEEDVRYIVRISLGRLGGMTVLEAADGAEGLELAKRERPAYILLDMMMPGMGGASVFHALRAAPETANIPVVFLTAATRAYDVERMKDLGAKGVISKPFDPLRLGEEIAAILAA